MSSANSQKIIAGSLQYQAEVYLAGLPSVCSSESASFKKEFSMKEIWKDIKNYEGRYQVSNFGEIKSLKRKGILKKRILEPCKMTTGYFQVILYKNNKIKAYSISRLVAIHFIENKYNKSDVNHKDGNKANNYANNLEWNTRKENIHHAIDNGLMKSIKGERNYNAKLTEKQIINIRKSFPIKTYNELSKEFNVTYSNIYYIIKRKTWKNI